MNARPIVQFQVCPQDDINHEARIFVLTDDGLLWCRGAREGAPWKQVKAPGYLENDPAPGVSRGNKSKQDWAKWAEEQDQPSPGQAIREIRNRART